MRAFTLTQPWAGLVASGIKLVENRPRKMIKTEDFGKPFAIHASRVIDADVYQRIAEIAPDVLAFEKRGDATIPVIPCRRDWYPLSRITSAVIAVGTIDKVFDGGWDAETIAHHAHALSFSNGERLGPDQVRWLFGPVGYVLRDVVALRRPVPCRGHQGFWTLHGDQEREIRRQIEPIDSLIARSSIGAGLKNICENGIEAELAELEKERR